jgi:hypothetical protein
MPDGSVFEKRRVPIVVGGLSMEGKCKLTCADLNVQYKAEKISRKDYDDMQTQLDELAREKREARDLDSYLEARTASNCLKKYYEQCMPERVGIERRRTEEKEDARRIRREEAKEIQWWKKE